MCERLRRLFRGVATLVALMLAAGAEAATLGELFPPGVASCYESSRGPRPPVGNKIDKLWLFASLEHLKQDKPGDLIMLGINVRLRNWKRMKTVGLICFRQADETWRCNERTCNGRTILLKVEGADKLALDLQGGLTLQDACGSQDTEKQSQLDLARFDQMFRLKRTFWAACRR